jgi:hypothetical protein
MRRWPHTIGVIFDMEDVPVTTEETDKRRTRITVLVAAVLVVVLGALVITGVKWIGGRLDQSATRARGEKMLAAIVWPNGWQRGSVSYARSVTVTGLPSPVWGQQIVTTADSLAGGQQAAQDALAASGWQVSQACAYTSDVTTVLCTWRSAEWVLRSQVVAPVLSSDPCRTGQAKCDTIQVALSLGIASPGEPGPLPSSPG